MRKKTLVTIELVAWFGFLNGLFLAVGVNPRNEIFLFLQPFIQKIGVPLLVFLFGFVPAMIMIYALYYIYKHGGAPGFLAVFLGFLGGFLILIDLIVSIGFLILAWIVGSRAAK